MTAPKNSPEVLALSKDAQAVLAGHWMMGAKFTLTLQNQKSKLSKRGSAAINELVGAEILISETANDGCPESLTYRLSDHGASLEFRKSFEWMKRNGKFSIVEPVHK